MKIIEPGHIYKLDYLDNQPAYNLDREPRSALVVEAEAKLVFVNREEGHEHPGTQTQEVLRALIDRTYHCDHCMPDEVNSFIIHHLRMALVYHEARALVRKAEKGHYLPEKMQTGLDGHFSLILGDDLDNAAPRREFVIGPVQRERRQREY